MARIDDAMNTRICNAPALPSGEECVPVGRPCHTRRPACTRPLAVFAKHCNPGGWRTWFVVRGLEVPS
jgi:hypothetical protein